MKIAIGGDHTAIEMKNATVDHLLERGLDVLNPGTDSPESCDYLVYGEGVGRVVVSSEANLGIAVCDTRVGISLATNKVKGIRACVCNRPYMAELSRAHNDSNVLALGAGVIRIEMTKTITGEWLDTECQGGRHQRQVDMMMDIGNR